MSEAPIRILTGTDDTQALGAKNFEYAVRRHTTAPVEFDSMPNVTRPRPPKNKNYPGTNFSFPRFTMLKRVGYQWNTLEKYEPGKTGLIHNTELARQPWLSPRNRSGWLWLEYLRDAIKDGAVTRAEIEEAVTRGWARPSRLPLLDSPRLLWKFREKTVSRRIDEGFVPHQDLRERQAEARKAAAQSDGVGTTA